MCGDDMTPAPVGQHCPACVADAAASAPRVVVTGSAGPVTRAALVVIGAVFVLGWVAGDLARDYGLVPALVSQGQWWRLLTSSTIHVGVIHLAFNGLLLWRLGEILEAPLGTARHAALLLVGAIGGGAGVVAMAWLSVATPLASVPLLGTLLATSPVSVTVGASGAVFALMGAAMAGYRSRGIDPWRTEIGGLVLINLILTLAVPYISVGGHVGGLVTGYAAGSFLLRREASRAHAMRDAAIVAAGALALTALAVRVSSATITAVLR
jgi:membrane associated rhomboid family serine protease